MDPSVKKRFIISYKWIKISLLAAWCKNIFGKNKLKSANIKAVDDSFYKVITV